MQKILIGLATVFILTSCGAGVETKINENITKTPVYEQSLASTPSKIKDTEEFAECMQPAVNSCVSSVVRELAKKTKSPDFCNELTSKDQQDMCRFIVVMNTMSEKQDIALCNNLSGTYQTQCIDSVYRTNAIQTKDIGLCEKIREIDSPITSNQYDQCIFGVVTANLDSKREDCNPITDTELKNMCTLSIKK